jgi:hypothetical protein
MVIVARPESGELPRAVRRFEGQVLVLYHNTTIQPGYQAVMHTGAVRQTCRIVTMDHPKGLLRTGDRCTVVFEFVSAPEVRCFPPSQASSAAASVHHITLPLTEPVLCCCFTLLCLSVVGPPSSLSRRATSCSFERAKPRAWSVVSRSCPSLLVDQELASTRL